MSFAILYSSQPLLPLFSSEFGVSPALSSLTLSLPTEVLAFCLTVVGFISDRFSRRSVMFVSLLASALLLFLSSVSPNFWVLLLFRAVQGVVLAGLPSILMAYIAEEFHPSAIGRIMGLYISGNSLGGMSGRIFAGVMTNFFTWRIALLVLSIVSVGAAIWAWKSLPESSNFTPSHVRMSTLWSRFSKCLRHAPLLSLFIIGLLLMGSNVAVFNYISYLLMDEYHLSPAMVGWVFLIYLTGALSSSVFGRLTDILPSRKVLPIGLAIMFVGGLVTLAPSLLLRIVGLCIFSIGFFGSHSTASGWVGRISGDTKAQASSLYLFAYYIGAGVLGTVGGILYSHLQWAGVISMSSAAVAIAVGLTVYLYWSERTHPSIRLEHGWDKQA